MAEASGTARPEAAVTTRTLARGLRVLEVLSRAEGPLRMVEVARLADLNLNTTGRLLATLESSGFARHAADGSWEVGAKLVLAATRALNAVAIANRARPHLAALRDAVGETTLLVTRAADELVVLEVVEGPAELRVVMSPGLVAPLLPAATGWALLADEPAAEVSTIRRRLVGGGEAAAASETRHTLDEFAVHGWIARHSLPGEAGTCTVAAPLRLRGAVVAALGIAGPSRRWNERSAAVHLPAIRACVGSLATALAGDSRTPRARLVGDPASNASP